jgi:hypothetical protein
VFLEISCPLPASICAKALKPSIFSSKINWSESKGSTRRDSRMVRRFWINIKRGFYPDPLDSIVISYPVRSAEY